MTKGVRHCQPFLLSLRAEGVAISRKQNSKIKMQKMKEQSVVSGYLMADPVKYYFMG